MPTSRSHTSAPGASVGNDAAGKLHAGWAAGIGAVKALGGAPGGGASGCVVGGACIGTALGGAIGIVEYICVPEGMT